MYFNTSNCTPNLATVIDCLKVGDYRTDANFQRPHVWSNKDKCYLIESIFRGMPLPIFFAYQDENEETGRVCTYFGDGKQRLGAIYDFATDELKLKGLQKNPELNGKRFSDLDSDTQRNFLSYTISVTSFNEGTPKEVIQEHYERINSTGVRLTQQAENRNRFSGEYYDFLRSLSERESFINIIGNKGKGKNYSKLEHERLCSLWACLIDVRAYDKGTVNYEDNVLKKDRLVDQHMSKYHDDASLLTDELKDELTYRFEKAVTLVETVFGNTAFRKPNVKDGEFVLKDGDVALCKFNNSMFETIMYFFSFAKADTVLRNARTIKNALYEALRNDVTLYESFDNRAYTKKAAEVQFRGVYEVLKRVGVEFDEIG